MVLVNPKQFYLIPTDMDNTYTPIEFENLKIGDFVQIREGDKVIKAEVEITKINSEFFEYDDHDN